MRSMCSNEEPRKMTKGNLKTADNSVVCHIRLSGRRKHTSIRCDEAIWEAFKQLCRANGLSTCDILEKLLIGFTIGLETRVAQPTTINVIVDAPRIVKRVRRRQLVIKDEITVCGFRGCEEPAVGSGVWRGKKEFLLCEKHLLEAESKGQEWKIIKETL